MRVQEIMRAPVACVELDDKLDLVKELFEGSGFCHLLVVDETGKLAGLISDRDLLRAVSPYVNTHVYTTRDLATLNQRVHQIMQRQVVSLHAQDSVVAAIALFNQQRVDCIAVVDEAQRPVGIVTCSDLLRLLGNERVLAVLDIRQDRLS